MSVIEDQEKLLQLTSEKLARKQLEEIRSLERFDSLTERLFYEINAKELIPCNYYNKTQELFPEQYFTKVQQSFIAQLLTDIKEGKIKLYVKS